jgi:septal ring factor EnvC (AmiA/AmiB activator)
MFRRASILFLSATCLLAAGEPAPPQDPAGIRRHLSEIQARMSQVDQQLAALKKRRRGVLVELQGLSLEAERVRAQADGARIKRDQAQMEVAEISARRAQIQQDLARLRTEIARQVRWTQAMGPLGNLAIITSLTGFEQFLVHGRYLAYYQDLERRRLDRIHQLRGDLARREDELTRALVALTAQEKEATQLQASLALNEERLQNFLEGLGQDESRQKALQAELGEEALQLERMLSQILGHARGDAFEPSHPFSELRGELPQPAPGSLAQAFGEHLHPRFKTRTMQSGVLISGEAGSPVQAVAEGRVVFVDIYQSYGPMVILDHGGGWFTLYTHMGSYCVTKGQILKGGETLGTVGDSPEGPRLGFEVRHQTSPQDPQKWLHLRYR